MMDAKFADTVAKQFDRVYLTAMKTFPDHRIRLFFEILLATYTDPGMPKLLKENNSEEDGRVLSTSSNRQSR